jgi:S-adenosylmethionine-diacylglycerol 3-amino-3-carboxypropyl transferase
MATIHSSTPASSPSAHQAVEPHAIGPHASDTAKLLKRAVRHAPKTSARGLQERLFAFWFNGLVYNQIWEDPDVDAAALRLGPDSKILAISSAGCNILNYLRHSPASITAVDLNIHHLSVARLKLACMAHLPDYESMFQFWGTAKSPTNVDNFTAHVAPHLDPVTLRYWSKRSPVGRRRIEKFTTGFYRCSRLGHLLSAIQHLLRALDMDPELLIRLRDDPAGRAAAFQKHFAPHFDNAFLRWISSSPLSVYNLGIPPEQFRAMHEESGGKLLQHYRGRVDRLINAWSLDDNYFAWQALGRRYDVERRKAVPPYLKPEFRDTIRAALPRVRTLHMSTIDALQRAKPGDFNAFVFLDSQDWMTADILTQQWSLIARVAQPGSRIIFRTAAAASPIERDLPPELAKRFTYHAEESAKGYLDDRSAIYGGFHLYSVNP